MTGNVPEEEFSELVVHGDLSDRKLDANTHQCLALAFIGLGNFEEASKELRAAQEALRPGELVFSCWRYLYVSSEKFREDLKEMEKAASEERIGAPIFFEESDEKLRKPL